MGVKIRFWKGAWWVFVNAAGRRKAKRIGDRETALPVAKAIREKLVRGDLNLARAADGPTVRAYSVAWLSTATGTLKASTVRFYEGALEQHILPALGVRPVTSI